MDKNRNSFQDMEAQEEQNTRKYGKEGKSLQDYEEMELDEIPDDYEDKIRRLKIMMEQLRDQGKLTQEEEEKVFGPGGYLDHLEISEEPTPQKGRQTASGDRNGLRKRFHGGRILHHMGKTAAVLAVVLGGIFVVSMSSEANRRYLSDTMTYILGGETDLKIDRDKTVFANDISEKEAIEKIKREMNISMPVITYKPQDFQFYGYEIIKESKDAYLYYSLGENILVIYASADSSNRKEDVQFEVGGEVVPIIYNGTTAIITEHDKQNGDTYSAQWLYNDVYYQIRGKIEKELLKKILERIVI